MDGSSFFLCSISSVGRWVPVYGYLSVRPLMSTMYCFVSLVLARVTDTLIQYSYYYYIPQMQLYNINTIIFFSSLGLIQDYLAGDCC